VLNYTSLSGGIASFSGLNIGGGLFFRADTLSTGLVLTAYSTDDAVNVQPVNVNVSEDGTTADYNVCLATSSAPGSVVNVFATPDSQVTTTPGLLTFDPASDWNTVKTVTVSALDDLLLEGPHTGDVTHATTSSDPTFNGTTPPTVTATITDNDTVVVRFQSATGTAPEAIGIEIVSLELVGAPGITLAVPISVDVSDALTGNAISGIDYGVFGTQTVTFPVGSTTGTLLPVNLLVIDDLLLEGPESVDMDVNNLVGPQATIVAPSAHTVTIVDDETVQIVFSLPATSALEEGGPHAVGVRLVADPGVTLAVPVSADVIDTFAGSATSGSDYFIFGTQTASFAIGSADGSTDLVTLGVIGDLLVEGNEIVELNLVSATGPGVTLDVPFLHSVTIVDDENPVLTFQVTASLAFETTPGHLVSVQLTLPSGTLPSAVTVDVTDDLIGTAGSGVDYAAFSTQTLVFPAGSPSGTLQSVILSPLDDLLLEGDETLRLGLVNATGLASIATPDKHTITVADDETAQVQFVLPTSSALEPIPTEIVSLELVASPGVTLGPGVVLTADVNDAGTGSANSGIDHVPFGVQTVAFGPGATSGDTQLVNLGVIDDLLLEGNETVDLSIGSVSGPGASIGAQSSHPITIVDDEIVQVQFVLNGASTPEAVSTEIIGLELVALPGVAVGSGVSVTATVADAATGTATSGSDHVAFGSQTVVFGAGAVGGDVQSVNLGLLDDLIIEGDEDVDLSITAVTGPGASAGAQPNHQITILDNDFAQIEFVLPASSVLEPIPVEIVDLQLVGVPGVSIGPGVFVTADVFDTGSGSATSGADYPVFGIQTAVFGPGTLIGDTQPILTGILDDLLLEGLETFELSIGTV
ncbi:MAG: hypothetical protein HOC77_03795, partial [Chloroflexi bacterium]|nr:hypothetical protein [Chloroflexota bacterium]